MRGFPRRAMEQIRSLWMLYKWRCPKWCGFGWTKRTRDEGTVTRAGLTREFLRRFLMPRCRGTFDENIAPPWTGGDFRGGGAVTTTLCGLLIRKPTAALRHPS